MKHINFQKWNVIGKLYQNYTETKSEKKKEKFLRKAAAIERGRTLYNVGRYADNHK